MAHAQRRLGRATTLRPFAGGADVRAVGLSLAISFLILGLNLLTGVLLARALEPDARGELAAVLLWPSMIAALGSLGVTDSVTYFAARRQDRVPAVAGTAVAIAGVQSLVLVLVSAAVLSQVIAWLDIANSGALYLSLAYIPLFLLADYLVYLLNGTGKHATFQALRFSIVAILAASLGALAFAGKLEVGTAVVAYLASYVAVIAAAALLVGRIARWRVTLQRDLAKRMLSYGLKSHVSTASALLNQRLDQLVIAVLLPRTDLGVYVIAVAVAAFPGVVGHSIGLVALPRIAGGAGVPAARRAIQGTFWSSALFAACLTVMAPRLIDLFFGTAYRDATVPAIILLVAAVFSSSSRTLAAVLKALGQPLKAGTSDAMGLAVTVVGLTVFVPIFGINGAALVSLVSYAAVALLMLRACASACNLPARALVFPYGIGTARPGRAGDS